MTLGGTLRRTITPVAAVVLALAGCSSSGRTPVAAPLTSVATTTPPDSGPAETSSAGRTAEALECGMFDMGAVYLNDEWPAIIGGHPRMGYVLNLEQAADTWQKGLNSYSSDPSLDAAIGRAVTGVHDMESAIAGGNGSAPVEIGTQVTLIRDSFTMITSTCAGIGYNMTQPLAG